MGIGSANSGAVATESARRVMALLSTIAGSPATIGGPLLHTHPSSPNNPAQPRLALAAGRLMNRHGIPAAMAATLAALAYPDATE